MGTMRRRKHILSATTGAIDWEIKEADDFDIIRVTLMFSAAPSAIENVKIWHKSDAGTEYDCVIRTEDPNGFTSLSFECVNGIESGDSVAVTYDNSDGLTIRGMAVVEV